MKKLFFCIFIFLISIKIYSVPSYEGSSEFVQPDGTKIFLTQTGDEFNHMVFYNDYPVYLNNDTGYWEYYNFLDEVLVESGKRTGIDEFNGKGKYEYHFYDSIQREKSTKGNFLGRFYYPVILINFKETESTFDPEEINENLISAVDYFYENSYGKFEIIFHIYGWYNSNFDKYQAKNDISDFIRNVLIQNDGEISYDIYDNDGDSKVDNVIVIHQGQGQEYSKNPEDIWSHSSYFQTFISDEGISLDKYTIQPEIMVVNESIKMASIGVLTHEMGHVIGLPDLYDIDYSSSGIGKWGNMAFGCWNGTEIPGDSPAHFSSWSKERLKWVDPIIINDSDPSIRLTLPEYEIDGVVYKYLNDKNVDEYFLMENRQLRGFDKALPGSGMIVYHIDNDGNQMDEFHRTVDVEEADGDNALDTDEGDRGSPGDPFPGITDNKEFLTWTTPDSNFYDDTQGPQLSGINVIENVVNFFTEEKSVMEVSTNYLQYGKEQSFSIVMYKNIERAEIVLPKSVEYSTEIIENEIIIVFEKIPGYTFTLAATIHLKTGEKVYIQKKIYPFSYIKILDGVSENYLILLKEYGWNEKPGEKWNEKNGYFSIWSTIPADFFNRELY